MIRIEEHGTGGRSALALRLLLGAMSKRISSSAGVATGEEVRFL
jgi:hypothetical protein